MPKSKSKSTKENLINRSGFSRFLRWNSPALWVIVLITVFGGTFAIYQSHAATVTQVPCSSAYRVGTYFELYSGYDNNAYEKNCVKNIQTIVYGYLDGNSGINGTNIDGYFGPGTQASVEKFQRIWKLSVDGVVGQQTWSKLCYVAGTYGYAYREYQAGKSSGCFN